jgi:GDP-L-fucose synthase
MKDKKMKTIVTGAGGMVGYAIQKLNLPDMVFLTKKDVDLTDFEKTKEVFQEIKPDRVIHLAALVGGIGGNSIHSGEYFYKNLMINTNVLESSRQVNVKNLVSCMSTCIFPNECEYPLNEKDLHKGPPHPSNFGYAYAKRMLDIQSTAYRKEWNCNFNVVIPTNIYGPNDNFSLEEGHVLPALIHKCYLAKKNNTDMLVWGSGKPLREFVLSDDIAKLILWTLDNYSEDSPIILSSGIEVSIKETVELVAEKMKFKGKIVFDSTKPDGQYRKPSDTTKLKKYLPDFKFSSLDKGLENTINWFEQNYPNIRK